MPAAVAVAGVFVGFAVLGAAFRALVFGGPMRYVVAVLIAALLPLLTLSCTPDGDTIIVAPTQTISYPPGSGVVVGTPTPSTPAGGGAVASVGVGFYGGRCDAGEVLNNRPLPVGCVAFATATPKDGAGNKLEPVVHGPDCQWANDRPDVVTVFVDGDNVFNASIQAKAPGTARVTATVKGVTGTVTVEVK